MDTHGSERHLGKDGGIGTLADAELFQLLSQSDLPQTGEKQSLREFLYDQEKNEARTRVNPSGSVEKGDREQ